MEAGVKQRLLLQLLAGVLVLAAGLLVGGVALAQEGPSAGGGLLGAEALADDDDDDDEFEFSGKVESLPEGGGLVGDWKVGDRIVHVTTSTEIDLDGGTVAVGTMVEVEGKPLADGSIVAEEIERDDDDGDDEEDAD
jgi:hypothetical protein